MMKQTITWGAVITMILVLLTSDVLACGNAMKGERALFTIEMIISLILFMLPFTIPWFMGKSLFYINKMAKNANTNTSTKDKRKLIYFFLVPWIPLLIVGTIIWFVMMEYLLRMFFGYIYSTSTFMVLVTIIYLLVTLFIYKIFRLTPFNKK